MPQLRRSNSRAIIDNGQGHELTLIPTTRKPAEDFCPVANRLSFKVNDNRKAVAHAGKALVSSQSERNIENLRRNKEYLANSRASLMDHLLTCETCK